MFKPLAKPTKEDLLRLKEITVIISQENIDNAVPNDPDRSPLALALRDMGLDPFFHDSHSFCLVGEMWNASNAMRTMLNRFDQGKYVYPREFRPWKWGKCHDPNHWRTVEVE